MREPRKTQPATPPHTRSAVSRQHDSTLSDGTEPRNLDRPSRNELPGADRRELTRAVEKVHAAVRDAYPSITTTS